MQRLLNGFRFLPVSKFCFPFTLVTLSTHYLGILFLTLTTIDPFSVYKFIKNCISWSSFFFNKCSVPRKKRPFKYFHCCASGNARLLFYANIGYRWIAEYCKNHKNNLCCSLLLHQRFQFLITIFIPNSVYCMNCFNN